MADAHPTPGKSSVPGRAVSAARADDLQLARACDAGDEPSWAVLTERCTTPLEARARARGASPAEAESAVSALLADLSLPPPRRQTRTLIGTYDGSGSLLGWLTVILVRRLMAGGGVRRTLTLQARDAEREGERRARGPAEAPLDAAEAEETAARLRTAVAEAWRSLDRRETLALVFKHGRGVPQKSIARMLGVSEPTCTRIVKAAQAKMRAVVLRALGGEPGRGELSPGLWARFEAVIAHELRRVRTGAEGDAS